MNFNKSTMVRISFTNGTLDNSTFCDKIEAAKIGRVAFFEPEIDIFPIKFFCL